MNGLGRKKENNNSNGQTVFTKETLGVVLILFATLSLVCLITRGSVFSALGIYVNAFLFGLFGKFAYAVVTALIVLGVGLVADKKIKMSVKRKVLFTAFFTLVALTVHVVTLHGKDLSFSDYLMQSYLMAGESGFSSASGGGLITAVIAYPLVALLTEVGAYVVCGIAIAGVGYFTAKDYIDGDKKVERTPNKFRSSFVKKESIGLGVEIDGERDYPVEGAVPTHQAKQQLFVNDPQSFAVKSKREMAREQSNAGLKLGFSDGGLGVVSSGASAQPLSVDDDYKKKLEYIKTPAQLNVDSLRSNSYGYVGQTNQVKEQKVENIQREEIQTNQTTVSDYINPRESSFAQEETLEEIPCIDHDETFVEEGKDAEDRASNFERLYAETLEVETTEVVEEPTESFSPITEIKDEPVVEVEQTPTDDIPFIEEIEEVEEQLPPESNVRSSERVRNIFFAEESKKETEEPKESSGLGFTSRVSADGNFGARRSGFSFEEQKPVAPTPEPVPEKPKKPAPPINREYFRPPFDLLESYTAPIDAPKENHEERMQIIQRTLEEFHINATPEGYIQGPSITRYEIKMPAGVSVKKVLGYDDDLKMWLSARDGVRIEAPIPGKSLVGIEVANSVKTTVGMREVLEESAGQKNKEGSLNFVLGKDIVGKPIVRNLAKGPHYLVAGATGSGKSVCLNVMIISLIMRYSPEDLRLILIDPKSVEFMNYAHIPHLMIDEIITEPKRALAVLSWAYAEMERRYGVFRNEGGGLVVDIDSYNSVVASDTVPKMPRIVIIIDELADLMETCKKDLESRIRALAQKARSAGIHLVLATQRPSVDIITGTIKANLPSRIAFKVMNFNDSQTILGEAGAEKLLGYGDMLCKTADMPAPERYQGAYISSREVNNVVNYIKEHNQAYFDDELSEFLDKETKPKQEETSSDGDGEGGGENEVSELFLKALWLAVNSETVSISLLQRRFQIGYSRAGGLVDKMERMGFVSGNEGSKARRVLLSREEFVNRFGQMPD
ncbi:MAG: hypothetical protein IKB67_02050 [Clostridia bacterium]|nr:hypothetical protein [Clostridia bacterium]